MCLAIESARWKNSLETRCLCLPLHLIVVREDQRWTVDGGRW
jgi:hypothetical protein